ncbi:MAG: DUF3108 domain-containing protein [Gemmatimonadota bacterium]
MTPGSPRPAAVGLVLALVAWAAPLGAQSPDAPDRADAAPGDAGMEADGLDDWRFPVGERLEYSVTWGGARIGRSVLAVEAIDTLSAMPVYRASLQTDAGPPFYRLEDRLTSWIRPEPFATRRFDQKLRQGGYQRDRRHEMDLGASTYTRYDLKEDGYVAHEEEAEVPMPAGALDDVAYFYFVRLLDLELGERHEFERYFKDSGNPVVLEVLRREEIRVPAGTFETIVVRPIIQTDGIFSEGGEAELFLTDDERRLPVRVKTRLAIGTANFFLTDYDPGESGALIDTAGGDAAGATPPDAAGATPPDAAGSP